MANSAFHPFGVSKWVVIHGLRGWRPLNSRPGWRRSVCGCRLSLRPIGCTPVLSVTWTALLQLRYAACGAIQVYAFMSLLWPSIKPLLYKSQRTDQLRAAGQNACQPEMNEYWTDWIRWSLYRSDSMDWIPLSLVWARSICAHTNNVNANTTFTFCRHHITTVLSPPNSPVAAEHGVAETIT